jgi:heme-degrading monooxygenase HmoA
MVIRITWGKLRAGAWNDFERTYRDNVLTKGKGLKGLRGRWLAQDSGDKDTGFAVSLWENPADMKAYEDSALYREVMAPLQPFFVGEYKTYRCDVFSAYLESCSTRPRVAAVMNRLESPFVRITTPALADGTRTIEALKPGFTPLW